MRDTERTHREWTVRLYLVFGSAGLLHLLRQTLAQASDTARIVSAIPHAALVIAIFVALTFVVSMLKFPLTEKIFVSFMLTSCAAMLPILGGIISAWIVVPSVILSRFLGLHHIGPVKLDQSDRALEHARIFGQCGVYGIPVLAAAAVYARIGGAIPLQSATAADALRIALAGASLFFVNNVIMSCVSITYGYSARKILRLALVDQSIYIVALPWSIAMAFAVSRVGWGLLLGLAFTGVLTNAIGQRLTIATAAAKRQLARASALAGVARAISAEQKLEDVLAIVRAECARIADDAEITIALGGVTAPEHADALVIPMIAHERTVGIIALRSRHRFTDDDEAMLTAVANQAAVAIENAALFRDMETKVRERTAEEHHSRVLAEQLAAVSQVLNESLDLSVVLPAILDQLSRVLVYESASIQMLEGDAMRVLALRGLPDSEVGRTWPLAAHPFNRRLSTSPEPFIFRDPHWEPECLQPIRAVIGVPLVTRDRIIGALTIDSHDPDRYTESDLAAAGAFGRHAAIAIENARLYARTQQATEAKSRFLANMSHEIRTPLNTILGVTQLMQRGRARDADDRHSLELIARSGEHLLTLINDVLSMAKIESGRITADYADFDLRRMLAAVEEMFRLRAEAKNVALVAHVANMPAAVRGDEAKLRQVLINLLGNAIKFTDSGSVTLRVAWHGGVASFAVDDTGCGIEPADLERLFEAFMQANDVKIEGTGLGLAICQNYVRLMGGEIGAKSTRGRGSSFFFDVPLPAAAAAAESETRSIIGVAPGTPRYRMLVADDAEENQQILEELFASLGFEVRAARDGAEAIRIWSEWHPQLIWMDIRMPGVDGYAATRAIRKAELEQGLSHTVIIAVTASAFEHDRVSILAAGCDDFIAKPFLQETIFAAAARHLGVTWLYDTPRAAPPVIMTLTAADVALLPVRARDRMRDALDRGDVAVAEAIVGELAPQHEAIARSLGDMIRGYRFDDVHQLLAGAESA